MSKSVIITGISSKTTETTVRKFVEFAGKIKELELKKVDGDKQTAHITFEKEESVKITSVFNDSIMDGSQIKVQSVEEFQNENGHSDEDSQHEGKSKIGLVAGILAVGYEVQETLMKKGTGIDAKLGVSELFCQCLSHLTAKLHELDNRYKVVEKVVHKATEIDNKFAVQDKVRSYASQVQDRASQALNTEPGKYANELYTSTYKQIGVIQCQARKIANDRKAKMDGGINGIEAH